MRLWRCAVQHLIERRATEDVDSALLFSAFTRYMAENRTNDAFIARGQLISTTTFDDVFRNMGDDQCLQHFRFLRADVLRVAAIICERGGRFTTKRNTYACTPILAACVVLKRMSTPNLWSDLEELFRKHSPQLSEIFWQTLDGFVDRNEHLITGPIGQRYTADRAVELACCMEEKLGVLDNCVGYIDGTVIEIARPSGDGLQNVVYNGHKRKHALKFQAITLADGMFYHVYGPVEGRRHDWTLYCRSEIEDQLSLYLIVDGKQYCIYGDSGYNQRDFMDVPFQGGALNADMRAFNKAMSEGRITIEWMFKEVKTFWTAVDFPRKLRVLQLPVGTMYLAGMLLCNMRNCFYANQTSQYFNCKPPTLEEYLNWRN